jgi:hypothetical protein
MLVKKERRERIEGTIKLYIHGEKESKRPSNFTFICAVVPEFQFVMKASS